MRHSMKIGFSFGITSGIITTLGLMVGLHSGTHSKIVIIGAIVTIAIADAMSDALGIHISEESENKHSTSEIWEATISTFLSKFVITLLFVIPVILCQLYTAIIINLSWGLSLLCILSYLIAKTEESNPWKIVAEHLIIAVIVIVVTHHVGDWISSTFT